MSTLFYVLSVMFIVVSILLIIVILLQKKRESGLGGAGITSAQSQTFWDKNKSRSLEGKLEKYTKYLAILFFILALAIGFVR